MSYYQSELEKVNTNSEFAPQMKFKSGGDDTGTKWMAINTESAAIAAAWLNTNFNKEDQDAIIALSYLKVFERINTFAARNCTDAHLQMLCTQNNVKGNHELYDHITNIFFNKVWDITDSDLVVAFQIDHMRKQG